MSRLDLIVSSSIVPSRTPRAPHLLGLAENVGSDEPLLAWGLDLGTNCVATAEYDLVIRAFGPT